MEENELEKKSQIELESNPGTEKEPFVTQLLSAL